MIFHWYSKWTEPKWFSMYNHFVLWQFKTCRWCGKQKARRV